MEWVQDWLDKYQAGPVVDPGGPATGKVKVEKGGWWGAPALTARSSYRHFEDPPDYGDPHIGFPGFSRSVHDTSHDGHLERSAHLPEPPFDLLHHRDEIDLRPSAGRAAHEFYATLTQPQCPENAVGHRDFIFGVTGERNPERVPDSFEEEDAYPEGRFDGAVHESPGLGDTEVQGVARTG